MSIHVRLSTTLRKYVPAYQAAQGLTLDGEGSTAANVAQNLGIPLEEIKFVMINGRQLPLQTMLGSDDRVAFFPPVGGG